MEYCKYLYSTNQLPEKIEIFTFNKEDLNKKYIDLEEHKKNFDALIQKFSVKELESGEAFFKAIDSILRIDDFVEKNFYISEDFKKELLDFRSKLEALSTSKGNYSVEKLYDIVCQALLFIGNVGYAMDHDETHNIEMKNEKIVLDIYSLELKMSEINNGFYVMLGHSLMDEASRGIKHYNKDIASIWVLAAGSFLRGPIGWGFFGAHILNMIRVVHNSRKPSVLDNNMYLKYIIEITYAKYKNDNI